MRALRAVKTTAGAVRLAQYDHLQSLLFGVPLAATEARITQVVQVIGPRLLGLAAKEDAAVEVKGELFGGGLPDPADIDVVDGVATIPVRGTFTPRAGAFDAMSGMISYEQLTALLGSVAENPEVRGIVLAIDSPGGAVAGVTEAAAAIAALQQPVFAVAQYTAASAAYWLAAQAERIFVSQTASVGSIGVYAVRLDATKADQQDGLAYTFVRSGARKGDGDPHKKLTTEEQDDLQRRVDQAAALFFDAVAEARGLSIEDLAALEGAVFSGKQAVTHGLADEVGTVADAARAMKAKLKSSQRPPLGMAAQHAKERMRMEDKTEAGAKPAENGAHVIPITDAHKMRDEAVTKASEEARKAVAAEHEEIIALCNLQDRSDLSGEFIGKAMSVVDVRKELQRLKAEAGDEATIQAHVGPRRGPSTVKIDADAIYASRRKDVERIQASKTMPLVVARGE